jgi:hypothetical protein
MDSLKTNFEAFMRISLKARVIILGCMVVPVLAAWWYVSAAHTEKAAQAAAPPVTTAPVDSAALRMGKAQEHWPEIKQMVINHCNHPLTAEVSIWDAKWLPMDSTAENVVVQGTGTAKNSFGVPDQFTYTAYLFINLAGHDTITHFDIR